MNEEALLQRAKEIFARIEQYDSVVIFGHASPDGDCVGSVMGSKFALQEYYPDKKIYAVGTHPKYLPSFVEPSDDVDDETIKNSIALLVDLSDFKRVEDQRILTAKEVVCFDHHISDHDAEFLTYRDEEAPSATYILAKVFFQIFGKVPQKAAPYLYLGLVTDSGRFQYDSKPETFEMAAKLSALGVDYKAIYRDLYKQSSKDLRFRSYVYNHFKVKGQVCYCLLPRKDYLKYGLTEDEAGHKVNLLSLVDGLPVWAMFSENEDGSIRVELRSDGFYNVQQVAIQFNGGGHYAASGAKLTTFDDVPKVIAALNKVRRDKNK